MKTISFALVMFLVLRLQVTGCKSHNEVNNLASYNWGDFTSIELSNSVNVIIKQGKVNDLRIEDEKGNAFSDISIKTEKNKLMIGSLRKGTASGKGITVYVTAKNLHQVVSSGPGDISFDGGFTGDRIELKINDSGNINAVLDTKILKINISGSGNLEVSGTTVESDIKISGSGNVLGRDLKTSTSNIAISGSGSSTVDVIDDLTVNITGSGNVYFLSYPERMNAKSKAVGQVEKIKA